MDGHTHTYIYIIYIYMYISSRRRGRQRPPARDTHSRRTTHQRGAHPVEALEDGLGDGRILQSRSRMVRRNEAPRRGQGAHALEEARDLGLGQVGQEAFHEPDGGDGGVEACV